MKLTSDAFGANQPIPEKYTCKGENISPQLIISEIPTGAVSLALIVDDPDAPRGTFDHWISWNISPITTIKEAAKIGVNGINGYGTKGYKGPCPPPGPIHHYHFKLYALDTMLDLPEGSSKVELLDAMQGHILEQAELIGTFHR